MMVVNQQHAHERILYEQSLNVLKSRGTLSSQQLLFPEILSLNPIEFDLVKNFPDFTHFEFNSLLYKNILSDDQDLVNYDDAYGW